MFSNNRNTANQERPRDTHPNMTSTTTPLSSTPMGENYEPAAYYIARIIFKDRTGLYQIALALVPVENGHDRTNEMPAYGHFYRVMHRAPLDVDYKIFSMSDIDKISETGRYEKTEYLHLADGGRVILKADKLPGFENLMMNTWPLWDEAALHLADPAVKLMMKEKDIASWHDQVIQGMRSKSKGKGRHKVAWVGESTFEAVEDQTGFFQFHDLDSEDGPGVEQMDST